MAIVTTQIHGVQNNLFTLKIVHNDANGTVQSATAANGHAVEKAEYTVWMIADPLTRAIITILPGATNVYTNLPGNVRYSTTERLPTDPRATNFEYSFRTYI